MLNEVELLERLLACKGAKEYEFQGCSIFEIFELEEQAGVKFPEAYKKFLLTVGKKSGGFMDDLEYQYSQIPKLAKRAEEMLNHWEDNLTLPPNSIVIATRMGEQFAFIIADGNSNPPIYHYEEGRGEFSLMSKTFWNFIEAELLSHEEYMENPIL